MNVSRLERKNSALFLFIIIFGSNVSAQEGPNLEDLLVLVDDSCPIIWEPIESKIKLNEAPTDIWQADTADKQSFISYMEALIIEQGGDPTIAATLADDDLSVATECQVRKIDVTATLLREAPVDLARAMSDSEGFLENAIGNDGSTPELGGASCLDIKQRFPLSVSGAYWLDVTGGDSGDAVQAFCEMELDGGGWTLIAHFDGAWNQDNIFTEPNGTYKADRSVADGSLGLMDEIDDTEMIISIFSADPVYAKQNNNYLRLAYGVASPLTNVGPTPCSSGSFTYSLELDGSQAENGFVGGCSATNWYVKNNVGGGLVSLSRASGFLKFSNPQI